MNIDEFQQHALKSAVIKEKTVAALAHRSLGVSGEAGVLTNLIKRIIRDQDGQASQFDKELIEERLGDVLYYVAILADYYNFKLSDIAKLNMSQSSEFMKERENQQSKNEE